MVSKRPTCWIAVSPVRVQHEEPREGGEETGAAVWQTQSRKRDDTGAEFRARSAGICRPGIQVCRSVPDRRCAAHRFVDCRSGGDGGSAEWITIGRVEADLLDWTRRWESLESSIKYPGIDEVVLMGRYVEFLLRYASSCPVLRWCGMKPEVVRVVITALLRPLQVVACCSTWLYHSQARECEKHSYSGTRVRCVFRGMMMTWSFRDIKDVERARAKPHA